MSYRLELKPTCAIDPDIYAGTVMSVIRGKGNLPKFVHHHYDFVYSKMKNKTHVIRDAPYRTITEHLLS